MSAFQEKLKQYLKALKALPPYSYVTSLIGLSVIYEPDMDEEEYDLFHQLPATAPRHLQDSMIEVFYLPKADGNALRLRIRKYWRCAKEFRYIAQYCLCTPDEKFEDSVVGHKTLKYDSDRPHPETLCRWAGDDQATRICLWFGPHCIRDEYVQRDAA